MEVDPNDFKPIIKNHADTALFCTYEEKNVKKEKRFAIIPTDENKKPKSAVCFAQLSNDRKNNPSHNRLLLGLNWQNVFPVDALKRWLFMSRANGCLPSYINIKKATEVNRAVIDLKKHVNNEIYVYATTLRMPHFCPNNVLNHITLVDKYGLDYYTAMIISFKLEMHNANHHFLPSSYGAYPMVSSIDNIKAINFNHVLALITFIKNIKKTSAFNTPGVCWHGFNCNNTIAKIEKDFKKKEKLVEFKDIFGEAYKKEIAKAIKEAEAGNITLTESM